MSRPPGEKGRPLLPPRTKRALGLSLTLSLLAAAPLACEPRSRGEAAYASSATEGGYALAWPEELAAARQRVSDVEAASRNANQELAKFVGELRSPDWTQVLLLYARADAAGRSAAYVETFEASERVSTFFAEEKEPIGQKVGGAAQYAAKQKGCTVDPYGTVTSTLEKAVAERLEQRLRAQNEAHRHLSQVADGFSREDAATLELQLDDLSLASYLAHQGIPRARARLERLLGESATVKDTLEREESAAQADETSPGARPARKAAAAARAKAAREAREKVDREKQEAEKLLQELDQREAVLRDEYQKAYQALRAATEAKRGKAK